MADEWKNKLYFGDNLDILRHHIDDKSIDLIYLDPPFNSQATYNVLFAEKSGEKSAAQITAFEDTWRWGIEAEATYREIVRARHRKLSDVVQALRSFLGANDMMAYLVMIAARLSELHRVLKNTGSLYLHCDPTASHYIKLLLDAAFGTANYRTEIMWKRSSAHSDTKQGRRQYGRIHDVIFFYTKSGNWTWHPSYTPYDTDYVEQFYKYVEPETGRRYRLGDLTGPGGAAKGNPQYDVMGVTRYWRYSRKRMNELISEGRIVQTKPGAVPAYKRYLDEMPGVPLQDLWTDINPIAAQAAERLGYPTQKPEPLLERIINTSSNEDDIILDPFCGCGTTIAVAERLRRRWIGIDITHLAIALMRHRLHDTFGTDELSRLSPYEVIGDPKDLESARALARSVDRYAFQQWAVGLVDAFPGPKGADRGVDGVIKFFDDESGRPKTILVQVKSGHAQVKDIRDLIGTLQREQAAIGAFITLEDPTIPMITEAATAGFYDSPRYPDTRYARVQILTIAELLDGKQLEYPTGMGTATFKKAGRRTKEKQHKLF